jgi:type VI secretion system protein ImpJ
LYDTIVEPEYRQQPFKGAGLRMQVTLQPQWLESCQLLVGVRTSLAPDACVHLLTRSNALDMKIGSSDRVDEIFRQGHQGLRFALQPRPPQALPIDRGWIFFDVLPEAKDVEWQRVQRSLTLALRVNEKLIVGPIQNQSTLTVRTPAGNATMEFMLFVVPQVRK